MFSFLTILHVNVKVTLSFNVKSHVDGLNLKKQTFLFFGVFIVRLMVSFKCVGVCSRCKHVCPLAVDA